MLAEGCWLSCTSNTYAVLSISLQVEELICEQVDMNVKMYSTTKLCMFMGMNTNVISSLLIHRVQIHSSGT